MTILRNHPPRHCLFTAGEVTVTQPGEWRIDLGEVPSQCYLGITMDSEGFATPDYFVLYLRWRHKDPWTCQIVFTDSNFEFNPRKPEWEEIPLSFHTEAEYDSAIAEAEQKAMHFLWQREMIHAKAKTP